MESRTFEEFVVGRPRAVLWRGCWAILDANGDGDDEDCVSLAKEKEF